MPYFIVDRQLKESSFNPGNEPTSPAYATRQEAVAACEPNTHAVFIPTSDEYRHWRYRESERFNNATYQQVPWLLDRFVSGGYFRLPAGTDDHFPHLSIDAPGQVAFTLSSEHGVLDRQTRMNPGRYLTRYYADIFSKEQIDEYVHRCQAATSNDYKIARSTDEIVAIYSSTACGFSSCMQRKDEVEYDWQTRLDNDDNRIHPVSAYGESDLGIAYRGPLDCVAQRAVVWPDKKTYYRIYGSGPLRALLKKDGYRMRAPDGARIRRIPVARKRGYVYMPYLDGIGTAERDGSWFVLGQGNTPTDDATGYVREHDEGEPEEDEEDTYRNCDHCAARYDPEDDGYGTAELCQHCSESQWTCDACFDEYFDDDSAVTEVVFPSTVGTINCHEYICTSCLESDTYTSHCADEHCDHTFVTGLFSVQDQRQRIARDVADLCADCAQRYQWCDTCEIAYDDTTCPTCQRAPRCTLTRDLFTDGLTPPVDAIQPSIWWQLQIGPDNVYWCFDTLTRRSYSTYRYSGFTLTPSNVHSPEAMDQDGIYTRVPDPRPIPCIPALEASNHAAI